MRWGCDEGVWLSRGFVHRAARGALALSRSRDVNTRMELFTVLMGNAINYALIPIRPEETRRSRARGTSQVGAFTPSLPNLPTFATFWPLHLRRVNSFQHPLWQSRSKPNACEYCPMWQVHLDAGRGGLPGLGHDGKDRRERRVGIHLFLGTPRYVYQGAATLFR